MSKRKVMLVAFYNKKALGVRYLETALVQGGYDVRTVFFKDFNSVTPRRPPSGSWSCWRRTSAGRSP